MSFGFLRVAAATPYIRVADCTHNKQEIVRLITEAEKNGASVITLPELCVTGYTCGDLFLQNVLLNSAKSALVAIAQETAHLNIVSVVGVPIAVGSELYNCAAVIN